MLYRIGLAVNLSHLVPRLLADFVDMPAFAASLEAWGADRVVLGEHIVRAAPRSATTARPTGFPPTEPGVEPLVLLGAVASRTSTLRLGTSIIVTPIRHPVVLAKAAASVDALSGGRLELGLGAGWMPAEFAATGTPIDERFGRLEEAIHVCRALWSDGPSRFAGRWTSFGDVYAYPKPARGTIPIWIGGDPTEITARRVARVAEGWIAPESSGAEDVRRAVGLIRTACQARDRDPGVVAVQAPLRPPAGWDPTCSWDEISAARLDELRNAFDDLGRAGATEISLPLAAYASDPDVAERLVRVLARR
jgi:probable F420-dependent oxidoreductase